MAGVEQSPIKITESSVDDLRRICRDQPGTLYAILDACDEPRVPQKVRELGPERTVSLYRGWAEREYWAIATYLVQVDEQLLDWIVDNLWEDPWGIFAVADTDLLSVRKHFRQFLTVEDPHGDQMYFRFYDPRVLSTFLNSCSNVDYRTLLGPLNAFLIPGETPACLAEYRWGKRLR